MITIVNIAICDSEEHCNAHQKKSHNDNGK